MVEENKTRGVDRIPLEQAERVVAILRTLRRRDPLPRDKFADDADYAVANKIEHLVEVLCSRFVVRERCIDEHDCGRALVLAQPDRHHGILMAIYVSTAEERGHYNETTLKVWQAMKDSAACNWARIAARRASPKPGPLASHVPAERVFEW